MTKNAIDTYAAEGVLTYFWLPRHTHLGGYCSVTCRSMLFEYTTYEESLCRNLSLSIPRTTVTLTSLDSM